MTKILTLLALFFLKLYKLFISPILEQLFGKACRYEVTCSEYAFNEIKNGGFWNGGVKSLKRFVSCNPWLRISIDKQSEYKGY